MQTVLGCTVQAKRLHHKSGREGTAGAEDEPRFSRSIIPVDTEINELGQFRRFRWFGQVLAGGEVTSLWRAEVLGSLGQRRLRHKAKPANRREWRTGWCGHRLGRRRSMPWAVGVGRAGERCRGHRRMSKCPYWLQRGGAC